MLNYIGKPSKINFVNIQNTSIALPANAAQMHQLNNCDTLMRLNADI